MDAKALARILSTALFVSWAGQPPAAGALPPVTITVHDLNPGDPSASLSPTAPVLFGGQLFFIGGEPDGEEVWVSDGTAAGTHPLVEIVPGSQGSFPQDLTVAGPWLFFSAWQPAFGTELWRSDGTALGTERVTDVNPGVFDSAPRGLVASGNYLYYSATDDDVASTLWRTEIDTLVTEEVSSVVRISGELVAVGGFVYFRAASGASNLQELWRSDGTAFGTVPVTGISCPQIRELEVAGNLIFLTCQHHLFVTDGSLLGIQLLKTFNAVDPHYLTTARTVAANGITRVFFAASDDSSLGVNEELWVTDGTVAGTLPMPEIAPGTEASRPNALVADQGEIFFRATNGTGGYELYWTTGLTLSGLDLNPCGDSFPNNFVRHNGFVYFGAEDCSFGQELWRTDRTTPGTTRVTDLVPGPAGSGVRPMVSTPLGLALAAREDEHGIELWGSNGTGAGTVRISDYLGTDSDPRFFLPTGNGVRFAASYLTGSEPWQMGAVGSAPETVADLLPGVASSNPIRDGGATLANGVTVFTAQGLSGPDEVWRTDGTAAGTFLLVPSAGVSSRSEFLAIGGQAFFIAWDNAHGYEPWVTDGTVAGTHEVADIFPGFGSSNPDNLVAFDGQVYFSAQDGVHGFEVWRSDGTAAGTEMVHDLNPTTGSFPRYLTVAGGRLLFSADDGAHGNELWSTDGVTAQLIDLLPGIEGSSPVAFLPWGSSVAFTALRTSVESELWRSDGTVAGTLELNVNPGSAEMVPWPVGVVPAGLVFRRETFSGNELALTAGTPGLVTPLGSFGQTCSDYTPLSDLNAATLEGVLYFGAELYETTGCELWRTDGTPAGTEVLDLIPGPLASFPSQLAVVGHRLFFAANDLIRGRELHELVHPDLFANGFETGNSGAWSLTVP